MREWTLASAAALVALLLTWATGASHDYIAYLQQFAAGARLGNPWSPILDGRPIEANAYGPLHALIGAGASFHPLLPKTIFASSAILTFFLLLDEEMKRGEWSEGLKFPRFSFLFMFSPLLVITSFVFGINDSAAGLAMCSACLFRARGRFAYVGVALGIGALLKFYPLLFVPLFAVDREGRLRLRSFATAIMTFLAGMALGYLVWGRAILSPFAYGTTRWPTILSPLALYDAVPWPSGVHALFYHLVMDNNWFVLFAASAAGLHAWRARLDYRIAAVAGILLIYFTYKVGHPQFYVGWLAVYAWAMITADSSTRRSLRSFYAVALFLSAFQLIYYVSWVLTGTYLHGAWEPLRRWAPLPYAVFVLFSLAGSRDLWAKRWLPGFRVAF